MSGTDTRLRELLEIAVGEPPGGVSVEVVRRIARRRQTLHTTVTAVGAAMACAAVSVVAVGLASTRPAASGHQAPGVPRFYLQQGPPVALGNGLVLVDRRAVVRNSATGKITATVRCPWAGAATSSDIPAAGHETFYMACLRTRGSGMHMTFVGSRIYRFQVTGKGTVDGYSVVAGGALPGRAVDGLAAAADGSAIAMSTFRRSPLLGGTDTVLVINTRTGAHANWSTTGRRAFGAEDLSLSPNGRELRFLTFTGDPQKWMLAQVSPAGRGGSLGSARMLVSVPALQAISYAQVSPDGSTVTAAGVRSLPPQGDESEVMVEQISVATGRVIRIPFLATFRSTTGGFGSRASSDPSGRYIIVIYGTSAHTRNGWIDHGRLVPLAPAVAPQGLSETW
jgi:hypothetical protein